MTNLNPIHECNAREVEMMVGKAMCAYANWSMCNEHPDALEVQYGSREMFVSLKSGWENEYEATVRCIAMFVSDTLPAICKHVIDRAEAELLTA